MRWRVNIIGNFIAILVVTINFALKTLMKAFVTLERSRVRSDVISSFCAKLGFQQFLNTGVIVVLVNLKADYHVNLITGGMLDYFNSPDNFLGVPIRTFGQGEFQDADSIWYDQVGAQLFQQTLIFTVSSNIIQILYAERSS